MRKSTGSKRRYAGVKASVFMAIRNDLLNSLNEVDAEITKTLNFRASARALARAKALFAERDRIAVELSDMGVDVEAHPAVWAHE